MGYGAEEDAYYVDEDSLRLRKEEFECFRTYFLRQFFTKQKD
jgi:hypothetical protein